MEESLMTALKDHFSMPDKDWSQYSPLPLAFLGDTVYDTVIRTLLVRRCNTRTSNLHSAKSRLVMAGSQAKLIRAIEEDLTPEEAGIYRRGRNAHPANKAKNATREDYQEATGFEALIGYLYLNGQYDRMAGLIRTGLWRTGLWKEDKEHEL